MRTPQPPHIMLSASHGWQRGDDRYAAMRGRAAMRACRVRKAHVKTRVKSDAYDDQEVVMKAASSLIKLQAVCYRRR